MPRGREVLQNLEPKRLLDTLLPTYTGIHKVRGGCERWDLLLIRHSAMEHRQGFYGSRAIGLVCVGEAVGKIGEGDDMSERELVLMVSDRCGME